MIRNINKMTENIIEMELEWYVYEIKTNKIS